jgi:hypothetical protein
VPSKIPYTPDDSRRYGAIGGLTSWANTKDRSARTAPARAVSPVSDAYWLNKVDPDNEMSESDRRKAAKNAKKAYYLRLSQKAVEARRARKIARENGGAA